MLNAERSCFIATRRKKRTSRTKRTKRGCRAVSAGDPRFVACARRGEARRGEARQNIKGEGESSKVKVLGRARLLALARRDEGETRIDRYPPASCALIAIPALVFARTLFPSVRYSPPSPSSSPSSSLLLLSRANFPSRGGGEWPSYRAS